MLNEAQFRRNLMKLFLLKTIVLAVPYLFFLVSDGYRNFLDMGHYWLVASFFSLAIAIWVAWPIYRLENPWRYKIEKERTLSDE